MHTHTRKGYSYSYKDYKKVQENTMYGNTFENLDERIIYKQNE